MMNVTVETSQGFPGDTHGLLRHLVGRFFKRLGRRVKRVRMTLARVPGGTQGRDKICSISAELEDGGRVLVVERRDKMHRAVIQCLQRSKALVGQAVRRRQLRRRQLSVRSDQPQTV